MSSYSIEFSSATEYHILYGFIGGFIVIFGVLSFVIKNRIYLSESFVAVAAGIIIGPYVANIIDPLNWGGGGNNFDNITLEFMRIVIGIQVLAAGVSVPTGPGKFLRTEWKSLAFLIGPIMLLMWFATAFGVWIFIPNVGFFESLLIASCCTPTDPVLANSAMKGRFADDHVPRHIQLLLSAESAANDGAGIPFFFFAILFLTRSAGASVAQWFYWVLLYQIGLSVLIGLIIGFGAKYLLKTAENRKWMDKESVLVYSIGVALLVIGVNSMIGSDDLLCCFVAGVALSWDDWLQNEIEKAHIQDVIENLLNYAVFIYIGAIIPWNSFNSSSLNLSWWRLLLLGVFVLLFRRLPYIPLLKRFIPTIRTQREAVFCGWFGPIGVAAVFYATLARDVIHEDDEANTRIRSIIFPVVMFMVFFSIIIHGITVPILIVGRRMRGSSGGLLQNVDEIETKEGALKKKMMNKDVELPEVQLDEMIESQPSLQHSREDKIYYLEGDKIIKEDEDGGKVEVLDLNNCKINT